MKIRSGYILREINSKYIVIPVGKEYIKNNFVITLNHSGKVLWEMLEVGASEDELVEKLLAVYDIDKELAQADVKKFVAKANEVNLLEQ